MQPARLECRRRFLRPAPVSIHHQIATHQNFAILRDPQLDTSQRRPNRIDLDRFRAGSADHRPSFCLAVTLHEKKTEREKETANIGFQPRTAGHRADQPPAKSVAHFCSYQAIEDWVHQPFS